MTSTIPSPIPHLSRLRRTGSTLLLATLALTLASGCSSTKSTSQTFAAVTLEGHSSETIRQSVADVFTNEGFFRVSRPGQWIYDRPTSAMSQAIHGGWFDWGTVRERVRLRLVPLGDDLYRLEAKAVIVRDAGEAFFEEETRMTRLRSGPYQKLLDRVAASLP